VTDAGYEQDTDLLDAHVALQVTQVHHAVHHLGHAEAVPEVVERVVPVIFLHAQL